MAIQKLRCPSCAANLHPKPHETQVVCEYCKTTCRIQSKERAHTPQHVAGMDSEMPLAIQSTSYAPIFVVIAVVALISAGTGIFLSAGGPVQRAGTGITFSVQEFAPCSIDGEGNEDIVALYGSSRGGDSLLYAGAFRGTDLGRVWEIGPFGSFDDPVRHSRIACVDDTVVVADYRGTVRGHNVRDGEEKWSFSVSDRVERMCADPSSRRLFVEVVDGSHKLVDIGLGRAQDAGELMFCPPSSTGCNRLFQFQSGHGRAACRSADRIRSIDGFRASYRVIDGDNRILIGHKHPGTRVPMAVGVDDLDEVMWTREIPQGDLSNVREGTPEIFDLVDGKLFVHYRSAGEWRLTALAADTGRRLWDVAFREDQGASPRAMRVTDCRIYIAGWWLGVLLPTDGTFVGTINTCDRSPKGRAVPPCALRPTHSELVEEADGVEDGTDVGKNKVQLVEVEIMGMVAKDLLEGALLGRRGEVRRCHEAHLRRQPGLRGELRLRMTINQRGEVISIHTQDSTLPTALENCMVDEIRTARYPETPHGISIVTSSWKLEP